MNVEQSKRHLICIYKTQTSLLKVKILRIWICHLEGENSRGNIHYYKISNLNLPQKWSDSSWLQFVALKEKLLMSEERKFSTFTLLPLPPIVPCPPAAVATCNWTVTVSSCATVAAALAVCAPRWTKKTPVTSWVQFPKVSSTSRRDSARLEQRKSTMFERCCSCWLFQMKY